MPRRSSTAITSGLISLITPTAWTSRSSSTAPIHDTAHQQEKDEQARMKLEDEAGWMVLRFHYNDADDGLAHDHLPNTAASSAKRRPNA